jgi:hypothetical protein
MDTTIAVTRSITEVFLERVIHEHVKLLSDPKKLSLDLLYTDEDVAKILDISKRYLRRLRDQREISSLTIGSRHYYLKSLFLLELCNKIKFKNIP